MISGGRPKLRLIFALFLLIGGGGVVPTWGWAQDPLREAQDLKMRAHSEYYEAVKAASQRNGGQPPEPEERKALHQKIVEPRIKAVESSTSKWFDKTLGSYGYRRAPYSETEYQRATQGLKIQELGAELEDLDEDSKASPPPTPAASPSQKRKAPISTPSSKKKEEWKLDGSEIPKEIHFP